MASTYRLIQPSDSVHWPPHSSYQSLGKRIRNAAEACRECRQNKVKCDRSRPTCRTCTAKERPCHYEGHAGQSRKALMKSRMRAMEKLFVALKSNPDSDAESLFRRIRSSSDILALIEMDDSVVSSPSSGSSMSINEKLTPRRASPLTASSDDEMRFSFGSPLSNSSSFSSPQLLANASASLIRLVMPNAATTKAATESFYRSSGRLFHVFSEEQVASYHSDVYQGDNNPIPNQKIATCCLAAVAAVGVQYNEDDFEEGMSEVYYNIAAHYFSSFIGELPLDAIKSCAVLAMYNVMDKSTVALAYIEVGLNMSRKYNLHVKQCRDPSVSDKAWADYRRTWRTLIWLSSTLGYISGAGIQFREMVPFLDVEGDNPYDIGNIVQMEMTKISLLQADILHVRLAFKEMTGPALEAIMKDLHDWHDRLPGHMRLSNVGREDLPDGVLLSIFHAHLLYLGTVILLYRRIASQFVKCFGFELGQSKSSGAFETTLVNQTSEGVTAARHSARILGLMLEKKGIFKRCWVVIFQSQTACMVMLHSAIQKQLHLFPQSSWKEDLVHAHTCLEALEFCGTIDSVALNFYDCLEPIYTQVASYSSPTAPPGPPEPPPPADYLLTIPPGSDSSNVSLSLSLLEALCRPFGDDDAKLKIAEATALPERQQKQQKGASAGPLAQLDRHLDWGWENSVEVQWDRDGPGAVASRSALCNVQSRFLGSNHPSGWAGGADDAD
ncbi:hypothetical protein B0T24DRAFT_672711 [Lasiosphaeria ovina]|uniref:Zn(2)-C6 fungal-type domain-containing protein n=1 Tax=Lasiosphaeria ovina TaxID=92902 RepID=A0AAE0TX28_9PEZI|nr:hypothetical protein B0T24DRAFT_672711 [Lasiosphaeria ovina]